MSVELVMPRAGLTMVEGTIGEWRAAEGAAVHKDEIIMEFENEKNAIEYACTADGILHIVAAAGDVVAVGDTIGYVAADRAEYEALAAAAPQGAPAPQEDWSPAPAPAPPPRPGARLAASGFARKIAGEAGVDLAALQGSGPGGRIVARDVQAALAARDSTAAPPEEPLRIPQSGIRRIIARNMHQSLQEMAQSTATVEVDATELLRLRKKLVSRENLLGCRVTVNDLLARATLQVLRLHPQMNATFDGAVLLQYPHVNLAIAVGAEAGLQVPVVREADRLSLCQLSNRIRDLAARAKEGRLEDRDQSDGTFTITNVGIYPIDHATPIISRPQVAIAGFGRAVEKPAVHQGEICIRTLMNVFVTFDHRVFDGLEIGRMLRDMKAFLENPESILA